MDLSIDQSQKSVGGHNWPLLLKMVKAYFLPGQLWTCFSAGYAKSARVLRCEPFPFFPSVDTDKLCGNSKVFPGLFCQMPQKCPQTLPSAWGVTSSRKYSYYYSSEITRVCMLALGLTWHPMTGTSWWWKVVAEHLPLLPEKASFLTSHARCLPCYLFPHEARLTWW